MFALWQEVQDQGIPVFSQAEDTQSFPGAKTAVSAVWQVLQEYHNTAGTGIRIHLFYIIWRGIKPILTPHDSRRHFGLSGIRTCDHPQACPKLYHCATVLMLEQDALRFIILDLIEANEA